MARGLHLFGAPAVVGEDGGFVAVSKPAGWRTDGGEPGTLLEWLGRMGRGGALPAGLVPCHRLDLETSGVVLCAAEPALRAVAGRWFEEGSVRKTYLALVHGRPRDKGVVDRPLEDPRRRGALAAVTRYRTIERLGGFALVEVRPETGRKHQIRRHLHGIGYPVVGDARYPPPRRVRVPGFPGRLWLHALRLELPDGRAFEAPLAEELRVHLEALRSGLTAR